MAIKMNATTAEYEISDESGYKFKVHAHHDPERGWNADVMLSTRGLKTAPAAVKFLRRAAEEFIRQLDEAEPTIEG